MKFKPEDKQWKEAQAGQSFTDILHNGKGSMLIKILSMINVVNAHEDKIDTETNRWTLFLECS